MYALEGFLARPAASPHAGAFVLKGGVLLAAYDVRRPTRDVDLCGQLPNDSGHVLAVIREIAAVDLGDGLDLDAAAATAEDIRDEDVYSGVRVNITGRLAAARLSFHIDVNVGDPIWPPPQAVTLPRLLGGAITLSGYPLPMICAEKIVTAVYRGQANTRWRDFVDVYTLTRRYDMEGDHLDDAVVKVAAHRQVPLAPLQTVLNGYAALAQRRWVAWRHRQHLETRLPEEFGMVVDAVSAFADPILTGRTRGQTWRADRLRWVRVDPGESAGRHRSY